MNPNGPKIIREFQKNFCGAQKNSPGHQLWCPGLLTAWQSLHFVSWMHPERFERPALCSEDRWQLKCCGEREKFARLTWTRLILPAFRRAVNGVCANERSVQTTPPPHSPTLTANPGPTWACREVSRRSVLASEIDTLRRAGNPHGAAAMGTNSRHQECRLRVFKKARLRKNAKITLSPSDSRE